MADETKEIWPARCTCLTPPGTMKFCPEHGGMWSYKCGACCEHLRQEEERKKNTHGAK